MKNARKIAFSMICLIIMLIVSLSICADNSTEYIVSLHTFYKEEALEEVSFSYEKEGIVQFAETDNTGSSTLFLQEGNYIFNFYKDGYKNIKKSFLVYGSTDINVTFEEPLYVEGKDVSISNKRYLGIKITSPKEKIVNVGTVQVDFMLQESGEFDCQLLSRKKGQRGFTIKTSKTVTERNNSIFVDYIDPDTYTIRIKCYDEYGDYDVSELLIFQVGSSAAKEFEGIDLISDDIATIENVLDKIKSLDLEVKKAVEMKKIDSILLDQKKKLKTLEGEFKVFLKTNATEEEVTQKKENIMKEILTIRKQMITMVRVAEIHEKIIYLPDHTFEDIFSIYERNSFLSEYSYTSEELRYLQENIILNQKITHIRIEYEDKPTESLTLITKSFKKNDEDNPNHSFKAKDILYAEQIPQEIAGEGDVIFFSDYEIIDDGLYLITPEEGMINYVIDRALQNTDARQAVTLILPKASLTSMNSITGHGILDFTGSTGNIVFLIIIFIVVIIGGTSFIPGTPLNVFIKKSPEEELKEYLTNTISCVEKFGVQKSLVLFPRSLDLFEKLPDKRKIEYMPMVALLSKYLEQESIYKDLTELQKNISFQDKLPSLDLHLADQIIRMHQDLVRRYNNLPEHIQKDIKESFVSTDRACTALKEKFNIDKR
jgi:hypothetical protein